MSPELRQAWMSHLCGLCLTLRDRHGQWARLATNVDAVLVSALVAAQAAPAHPAGGPGRARRLAGPCPLRGMRRIEVDIADEAAPRLAAAVSLAAGATSVRDHVADGDGLLRLRTAAALARRVAGHAAGAAGREGRGVGLDVGLFERAAAAGRAREHAPATGGGREALLAALAPTEASTSAVLAHTAVLAGTSGRAGNEAHLGTVGGRFGRIVHPSTGSRRPERPSTRRAGSATTAITTCGTPWPRSISPRGSTPGSSARCSTTASRTRSTAPS